MDSLTAIPPAQALRLDRIKQARVTLLRFDMEVIMKTGRLPSRAARAIRVMTYTRKSPPGFAREKKNS
jgi:hypothetical protein